MNRVYKLPSLKRKTSVDIFESFLKLPTVRGRDQIEIKIEDSDFVLKYQANKKRVKLNYSLKNIPNLSLEEIKSPVAGLGL